MTHTHPSPLRELARPIQCVCVTRVLLSRDAVQDENLGLVFPARVELRQFSINVNGHATPLTAGLAATAEIRTGRRRIIEFLLSPLQRRVEEAGRER